MKRKIHIKKIISKKSVILATVSLILAMMTAISVTTSWIEDVSQVEFSSENGQQTPLHISGSLLESDIITQSLTGNSANNKIMLSEYFNKSGDIHLSPCFGDGDNFYFPKEGGEGYRTGTKDDANVNYLSVTFRVRSIGAGAAYWFEQSVVDSVLQDYVTFKDGSSTVADFSKYLRCSITVDGATNVYSMGYKDSNNNNQLVTQDKYNTIAESTSGGNTTYTITEKDGRSVEEYAYYDEAFNSNIPDASLNSGKPNQGGGDNLDGNTLFTVNAYDEQKKAATVKTVTFKLWLECPYTTVNNTKTPLTVSGVDIANINLNLVSTWAKTRWIYVKDCTVDEYDDGWDDNDDHTGTNWLSKGSAKLYWALKSDLSKRWQLTRVSSTSQYYYITIPDIYSNEEVVLLRTSSNGLDSHTNNTLVYTHNGKTVYYWDKWETSFPNSYHSEIFSVYSHKFGTWKPNEKVRQIYFVNSAGVEQEYMDSPTSYMWDHNTEYGTGKDDKVVMNKAWPGEQMTRMATGVNGKQRYTFFYISDFDRAVFSDGRGGANDAKGYQTQNLTPNNHVGDYFEMSALKWYSGDTSEAQNYTTVNYTNNYLCSSINQNGNDWAHTNFLYGGYLKDWNNQYTNNQSEVCRMYVKPQGTSSTGSFEFTVKLGNKYYGNNGVNIPSDGTRWDLGENESALRVTLDANSIYDFYLTFDSNNNPSIRVKKTINGTE